MARRRRSRGARPAPLRRRSCASPVRLERRAAEPLLARGVVHEQDRVVVGVDAFLHGAPTSSTCARPGSSPCSASSRSMMRESAELPVHGARAAGDAAAARRRASGTSCAAASRRPPAPRTSPPSRAFGSCRLLAELGALLRVLLDQLRRGPGRAGPGSAWPCRDSRVLASGGESEATPAGATQRGRPTPAGRSGLRSHGTTLP